MTYGLPEIVTAQTLFDKGVTHLREQGEPANAGNVCLYRLPRDGKVLACVVGCLMPDAVAVELGTANLSISGLLNPDVPRGPQTLAWANVARPHTRLLSAMQTAHDAWPGLGLMDMLDELRTTAGRHGLNPALVNDWIKEIENDAR